jgi:cell division protein FtsI/penicillin-binding protein 2
MAAAMVVVVGVLTIGFATGFGSESSAEPTVQAFLLDWEEGKYTQAAALTSGASGQVAAQLAAAYVDLDASDTFFSMKSVTQHGSTAVAYFKATVDLAEGDDEWTYVGEFGLTQRGGQWSVDWAPNVINPSLGSGDRLAVLTMLGPRGEILDSAGKPLLTKSADYHIGVYPGLLTNAARTAAQFSQLTGLNSAQVLGQIHAAPPRGFLSLLTLDATSFRELWPQLAKVPGLSAERRTERLFDSVAPEVVGTVQTEDSGMLRDEGAAYLPGTTIGRSGLESSYQDALMGTPTTSVVVLNSAGRPVATLWSSPGRAGSPVRTTLDSRDQAAAGAVLAGQSNSGEIVAVDSTDGDILALASRDAGRVPLPDGGALDGKLAPGMAFSIVSAAALLDIGKVPSSPVSCQPVATVGGQTFTYQPVSSSSATLAADFADGCGTAFATMSQQLTAAQFRAVERSFGIGAAWNLRVPAFSGSAASAADEADLAAQAIGADGVLVSPLAMAMVAAEVDAGTGRAPVLVATDPAATWQAPLSGDELTDLRELMREAVRSGSAHAANVSGEPVYGQAGVVQTGAHAYLGWFVGYRGSVAVAVLETGTTSSQAAAAALAGAFLTATR